MEKTKKRHIQEYISENARKNIPGYPLNFQIKENPKRFTFIREFCFSDRVAVLS
jgi:hypothetical protein